MAGMGPWEIAATAVGWMTACSDLLQARGRAQVAVTVATAAPRGQRGEQSCGACRLLQHVPRQGHDRTSARCLLLSSGFQGEPRIKISTKQQDNIVYVDRRLTTGRLLQGSSRAPPGSSAELRRHARYSRARVRYHIARHPSLGCGMLHASGKHGVRL